MVDIDREATTLRAQAALLLARVRSQSSDLGRALKLTRHDPALQARLTAAAVQLNGLTDTLSHALAAPSFPMHAADLVAIEGAMQTNETGALLSEAAAAHAGTGAILAARLAAMSVSTRHEAETLSHDLFERRLFEPYLHFDSPADEAGFREREAEAKRYIAAQLAKGTPEGNLNAGGGELSYLLDAHAHGAGDSPDFLPRWNALVATTRRQHAAMRAAGQSTEEYDRTVSAGVRRYLKDKKHLSDAEIDRILTSHADPLDAVKLLPEKSARDHGHAVDAARSETLPEVVASPGAAIPTTAAPLPLDAMTARLKAAGVRLTDTSETDPAHGVTLHKPAAKTSPDIAP